MQPLNPVPNNSECTQSHPKPPLLTRQSINKLLTHPRAGKAEINVGERPGAAASLPKSFVITFCLQQFFLQRFSALCPAPLWPLQLPEEKNHVFSGSCLRQESHRLPVLGSPGASLAASQSAQLLLARAQPQLFVPAHIPPATALGRRGEQPPAASGLRECWKLGYRE